MLKIRLTRTGKKGQPSYRVVVAEHTAPIKGRFVELLGHYNISRDPKQFEVNLERVKHWISVGAQPTDTVASLLKQNGMDGMDEYIGRRDLKRKKKKDPPEEAAAPQPAPAAPAPESTEEVPAEAPAEEASTPEEAAPEKEDAPAEEA